MGLSRKPKLSKDAYPSSVAKVFAVYLIRPVLGRVMIKERKSESFIPVKCIVQHKKFRDTVSTAPLRNTLLVLRPGALMLPSRLEEMRKRLALEEMYSEICKRYHFGLCDYCRTLPINGILHERGG